MVDIGNATRFCAPLIACAFLRCESDSTLAGVGISDGVEAGAGTAGVGGKSGSATGGISQGGQTNAGGYEALGSVGGAGVVNGGSSGGLSLSPDASVADSSTGTRGSGGASGGGASGSNGAPGSGGASSGGGAPDSGTNATGGRAASKDASRESSDDAGTGMTADATADVDPFPGIACRSGFVPSRALFETTIGLTPLASTAALTERSQIIGAPNVLVSHDGSTAFGTFVSEYRAMHYLGGSPEVPLAFFHAFEWSGSHFRDLGTPPGYASAHGLSLQKAGQRPRGDPASHGGWARR